VAKKKSTENTINQEKNKKIDKYELYENSVQTPDVHALWFQEAYQDLNPKKKARVLREDFCGTFQISCEWVKLDKKNSAIGVDLDSEPLKYGMNHNLSQLSPHEQKRLSLLQKDVLSVKSPPADFIFAGNYSFFIFKKEELLIRYFKRCYQSLKKNGVFLLELAGGPGMIEMSEDKRVIRKPGKKSPWFTYLWEQKRFDPVSHDLECAIHFRFPNGEYLQDAFTYDWRLWTIPEIRYALSKAGFDESHIFWEGHDEKGVLTEEYHLVEKGENDYSWVAYVAGVKRKA
jgi:SAM-dependent methyltransferase